MNWRNILLFTSLLFVARPAIISADVDSRSRIDSLLTRLPHANPDEKTFILLELSKKYMTSSPESSKEYALQALSIAKEMKDYGSMAEAYKSIGNVYYHQGFNNEVIAYYDSSLNNYSKINDSTGMAKVWNNLGIIFQHIGIYERSIDFHIKSLNYKTSMNDTLGIISSVNNIGSIYYDLGEFVKSEEYFLKALELSGKIQDDNYSHNILNNLGLICQELGNYDKSIEFLEQSLQECERINDKNCTATSHHNLGKGYFGMGEFHKALDHYFLAAKIYDEIGVEKSQTLNNIGQIYIELDYYKKALDYLFEALKIAKKNNQFVNLRDIYNNISVAYERLGQFQKAYENYVLFNVYDDSIRNQMYSNRIENIYQQANLERRQKELETLNLETQLILEKKDSAIKRKNFLIYAFIGGIVAVLALVVVLLNMFRHKTKANKLLKVQNEEIIRSDNIIKKINKALIQNEEMLRSIFDASPSAIIVIDPETVILDCNNASLRMFGALNKREIINKSVNQLMVSDQIKPVQEFISNAFQGVVIEKQEFTLVRKDDSIFRAEISGGLIKDSTGKLSAYVMIITDITERLHFIENLNQAKLEAEESDRLKTAFLANMSHEIRTPMNSIIGFSNLLNEPELKHDKKEEYLQHILQSSNLLLNLIDDIIDISKIEAGQINVNPVECKVNPLVRDLFSSFKETTGNDSVELKLNIPPDSDLYSFKTDPFRLRQILFNLIGNAMKFTEKGFIELGYNLKKNESRQMIEFYLRDTGIGIPKDKQTIIFERFRQVDDSRTRKFGGTGLGLAISKKLVDLMGGTIWVESEIDKGSTFYFSLPFESGAQQEIIQPEPFNAIKYNWKGKTLLIAEDENSNFELIKASIGRTQIKIIRAMNGEEAVEHVKRNQSIDLVLMDIRMPKLNGYDATRQMKIINPKLPVISITAYAMSEDESKSIEAGCDKYISKPIRPSNLLNLLNEFITLK